MKFAIPVISLMLLLLGADERPSVRVLCYHAFKDKKNSFSFKVEELRDQINLFKSKGFTFISVNDLVTGKVSGDKNILVTIDDGNRSLLRAYREVFKPNHIRPLLAIYPNIIGKMSYALTWEELADLVRDGCDIAAHGYYHNMLNEKSYKRDKKSFYREIVYSKKVLEEKLKIKVHYFVYPFGIHSPRAVEMVKENGYKLAFTIKPGRLLVPVGNNGSIYELPRYMLTQETWKGQVHKIAGALPADTGSPQEHHILLAKANTEKAAKHESPKKTAAPEHKENGNGVKKASGLNGKHAEKLQKGQDDPEHKIDKGIKKGKKRREGKHVAEAVPIAPQPETKTSSKEISSAAQYDTISAVAPASGDFVFEDSFAVYAAEVVKKSGESKDAPLFDHSLPQKERHRLMKEYVNLAEGSYKTYSMLVARLQYRLTKLRFTVENFIQKGLR